MIFTHITRGQIDPSKALSFVSSPKAGTICSLIETVKNKNHGKQITSKNYHCVDDISSHILKKLAQETESKFDINHIFVTIRQGHLQVGEINLMMAISGTEYKDVDFALKYMSKKIKELLPMEKKSNYFIGPPHPASSGPLSHFEEEKKVQNYR